MNANSDLNPQDEMSSLARVASNEGETREVLPADKPVVRSTHYIRPAGKAFRPSFRVDIDSRGHSHDID